MLQSNGLYFLALVPEEPIISIVQNLKKEIAESYSSKAALKSPPHITLHMPFQYPEKKENLICEVLSDIAISERINLNQQGFGSFPPRVIYIDVIENESLRRLQKEVTRMMKTGLKVVKTNYKDQAFRPHMTIAFRDLKKTVFAEAWSQFSNREINFTWQTSSFWLMKHNGERWNQHKEFEFVANH